jgi:hypothetical protein
MPNPQDMQQFDRESLVVVYNPADGSVVHRHYCSTSHGGVHPDDKTLEKSALEFASLANPAHAKMSVLHLDPAGIKPKTNYRVDLAKLVLVEVLK